MNTADEAKEHGSSGQLDPYLLKTTSIWYNKLRKILMTFFLETLFSPRKP